jgi:acyl-coenzyme A synthetase/AMP-(fatty) acid ligase
VIKPGGVSLCPAEVEATLLEHPYVIDAAVIGLPDREWGQRVHAAVQIRGGTLPAVADLIAFVRIEVSAAKVPKSAELVTKFPRIEAGKVNRSALLGERV